MSDNHHIIVGGGAWVV